MRALDGQMSSDRMPRTFVADRTTDAAIAVLALAGAAIATYLALVQVGAVGHVWDPVFGDASSRAVLTSPLSRALPVPDAALGAIAYLLEAVLAFAGTTRRFERSRATAVACGVVAAGLLVAAIGLVISQVAIVHAFCSLCLASAAISVVAAALAIPEGFRAARSTETVTGRSQR